MSVLPKLWATLPIPWICHWWPEDHLSPSSWLSHVLPATPWNNLVRWNNSCFESHDCLVNYCIHLWGISGAQGINFMLMFQQRTRNPEPSHLVIICLCCFVLFKIILIGQHQPLFVTVFRWKERGKCTVISMPKSFQGICWNHKLNKLENLHMSSFLGVLHLDFHIQGPLMHQLTSPTFVESLASARRWPDPWGHLLC